MAGFAALLGAGAYGLQAWGHLSGQASVHDEGLYLYKGFLFASGRYWPFQDYGPWMDQMPLAFLIPGWVQLAVQPGIRTGRMYAFVVALLMLVGIWILGRRLGGRWGGAGAVWILALNPALVKIYSQAISQVLIAALLAWVLVLTLGEGRPSWLVSLGSGLAGLVVLTRINLLPLLPLLVWYIWREHGRRMGIRAALIVLLVVGAGHAMFWPGILKLWAYWLPDRITPFLDRWREDSGAILVWDPSIGLSGRLDALQGGLRRHLVAFLGILAAGLAWPGRSPETRANRRSALFLFALFAVLLGVHGWASLGLNYCVYCFQMYLAFFSFLGVLLFVLAFGRWFGQISPSRQSGLVLTILLVTMVIGSREFANLPSSILSTQLPRIKELRLLPGTGQLAVIVQNKFKLPFSFLILPLDFALLLWILLLVGALSLMFVSLATRLKERERIRSTTSWLAALTVPWLAGLSIAYGNSFKNYDCGQDILSSYEAVGRQLSSTIPPGSLLYWAGGLSLVPLLYLSEAQIFPAQLHVDYSFRMGGDPASLVRYGFWNRELAETWLRRSDYALVEERVMEGWLAELVRSARFEELAPTSLAVRCRPDSWIHVFRRVG